MKRFLFTVMLSPLFCGSMTAQTMSSSSLKPTEDSAKISYSKELETVVIKGQRSITKLTGNSMITRIKGSALEKSGTAREMLAKVPGMTERDGELEVNGRGKPIFYVNGRKMQDMDELKRLRSEEIQSVEVITNPGAEYDATVSSVVRIKTIRRQGEGFGFNVSAACNQDLEFGYTDPSSTFNLQYRHNSLELFGMVNYWKWDTANDNHPIQSSWTKKGNELINIVQDINLRHDSHLNGFNYNLGFNYQIAKDHTIGARIEKHDMFNSGTEAWITTNMQRTGEAPTITGSYQDARQRQPYNWDGNVYYNGQVGKLNIDFNFDFMTTKSGEDNTITEWDPLLFISSTSSQLTQLTSASSSDARLFADKLILSYPVWKGSLQVGTEMSFLKKNNDYTITGYPLPTTQSEMDEKNIAAFIQYQCEIPRWGNFSAGLRYEHVGFDYEDKMDSKKSMSRYNDDFFPSLSWSNQWGAVQTSLAYSIKTVRPSYQMLDESIIYINSYSLQQGDPTLKNAIMNEVSINARWKWLNLFMAYERRDDTHSMWSYIYNNDGVILVKNINLEKPVRNFAAFLTATPTFGVYSLNWTAGWQRFFYTLTLDDPREATGHREESFNKPLWYFDLNNTFRLKHSWQLEANMNITSAGDAMNFHLLDHSFNLNLAVQKCWLKDDALCLRVTLSDALKKVHTHMKMDCGYYLLDQDSRNNRQRLDVSLRYTFNASKSRYRGTGAGQAVKDRL